MLSTDGPINSVSLGVSFSICQFCFFFHGWDFPQNFGDCALMKREENCAEINHPDSPRFDILTNDPVNYS